MSRKEENKKRAPQFHKMNKKEEVKEEPVNEVKDAEPVKIVEDVEPINEVKDVPVEVVGDTEPVKDVPVEVVEPIDGVEDTEPVNEAPVEDKAEVGELSYPILTRVVKDYQDSRTRNRYSKETIAYKEAFLKTVMLGFRRKSFTQADVDYVSNLLCNVDGFGELELITSISKQSLIDMTIFYFGKLEKTKITIVDLPMAGLHVGKIRKV